MNGLNPFRSLAAAGMLWLAGAFAQNPYTWNINGMVVGCTPGQTVNVQTLPGTLPVININIPVDPNTCTYSTSISLATAQSAIQLSTMCQGVNLTWIDSAQFSFFLDTANTTHTFTCGGGGIIDCMGVMNGPALPGTPCDDGNPLTGPDLWDANCDCVGGLIQNCDAAFSVIQNSPWTMQAFAQPTGTAPFSYQWWMPDGSSSTQADPTHTFTMHGVYGICLTIMDATSCTSTVCDTIVVDTLGYISTTPVWFDCMGVLWGPAVPGTPCDDGDPNTFGDTWTPNCSCVGMGQVDCLGIPGGPNMPGTACVDSIGGMIVTGIWDAGCICVPNAMFDCLGVPNGPNMPGTPCDDGDPNTVNDSWSANCVCAGVVPGPCEADFWVMQAYQVDSLNGTTVPIPNVLWIWNLSSGGTGTYSFLWNFGDGTTSTAAFPTHFYPSGGPYLLCLTIDDGAGCVDTHCDSVYVDPNGIYNGMAPDPNDRSGFTINVIQSLPSAVPEQRPLRDLRLFPNPATDRLTLTYQMAGSGTITYMILDQYGRLVRLGSLNGTAGENRVDLPVTDLTPGMYLLRIGNDRELVDRRFVRSE